MSGPRALKEVLAGWKPRGQATLGALADDAAAAAFASAWETAVGPDVARRSRPTTYRSGVLTVLTASTAWSDELSLHAPTILMALRRAVPQKELRRLRFSVASGRTKLMQGAVASERPSASVRSNAPPPLRAQEDVSALVRRLAASQQELDAQRDRTGWTTCASCGRRFSERGSKERCALCAERARTKADADVERVLIQAPWLSLEDVRRAVPSVTVTAYERARARLLARWQLDLESGHRRLRRGALGPSDRVVAWSYVMLAAGMSQAAIGRAVVEGLLGGDWASVLFGDVAVPKTQARRSQRENLKR